MGMKSSNGSSKLRMTGSSNQMPRRRRQAAVMLISWVQLTVTVDVETAVDVVTTVTVTCASQAANRQPTKARRSAAIVTHVNGTWATERTRRLATEQRANSSAQHLLYANLRPSELWARLWRSSC